MLGGRRGKKLGRKGGKSLLRGKRNSLLKVFPERPCRDRERKRALHR